MAHFYMTDYGPVRVSESESWCIRFADMVSRYRIDGVSADRTLARAQALREACERVAAYRHAEH